MNAILLLLILLQPPQIFVATGRYAEANSRGVDGAIRSLSTSGESAAVAPRVRLQFWSASWCGYCGPAKAEAQAAAAELGIKLEVFDWDRHSNVRRRVRVSSVPTLFVIIDDKISYASDRKYVGRVSRSRIVERVKAARTLRKEVIRQRLPVVQTQWGTIDLETYSRNCNCSMCQGIRSLQRSYRAGSVAVAADAPARPSQEPAPDVVIDRMLDLMRLGPNDVLADLGCGDGRILIQAVRRSGCRAIGVEIDPEMADRARQAVAIAGLSDRIEILTCDVLDFDPEAYGVTAITAYLYPELLAKLTPKLLRARVAASPFHPVEGLPMTEHDGVWIYRKE